MRALLVQLSDIHVTGEGNPVLERQDAIVDAVKNIDYCIDLAIILATGDLANGGGEDEYWIVRAMLESLQARISQALSWSQRNAHPSVFLACIPGNHDCNLPVDKKAERQKHVEDILSDPDRMLRQPAVLQTCLDPQAAFFRFFDNCARTGLVSRDDGYSQRLVYEYRFSCTSGSVRVLCCNSAALTQRTEIPGRLYLPPNAILETSSASDDLSVVICHHPPGWLRPDSANQVELHFAKNADFVFTGHEHAQNSNQIVGSNGSAYIHVEAGALQDKEDRHQSSFNAVIVDTLENRYKHAHLVWDGLRYGIAPGSTQGEEGSGLGWRPFSPNPNRATVKYTLSEDTARKLSDPGVTLIHTKRGQLRLDDFFVEPEVREVEFGREEDGQIGRAGRLLDLLSAPSRILVTSDAQAGRTTLAKWLFSQALARGFVPVWISSDERPYLDDRLYGTLEELYKKQYASPGLAAFRQLDRSRRMIIVDDYDRLPINPSTKPKLVRLLEAFADHLLLLGQDVAVAVEEIAASGAGIDTIIGFRHYKLMPFGKLLQNDLATTWLCLDPAEESGSPEFAHKLADIRRLFDTLIGQNFLPAYPVYLLSALQAYGAATPIDTRAGSHGYFYELFIKNALARGKTTTGYDLISSYLAHVAYEMYSRRKRELSLDEIVQVHQVFIAQTDVSLSLVEARRELVGMGILAEKAEHLSFRYDYLYYYFVASYISSEMYNPDVRREIDLLAESIHVEENANILLFLTHLTRDPAVIAVMLDKADRLFSDVEPTDLASGVEFLQITDKLVQNIASTESDHLERRREHLRQVDSMHRSLGGDLKQYQISDDPADREAVEFMTTMGTAVKTVQILGQVLKNFPGSLKGDQKLRIARACTLLGLRSLNTILKAIGDSEAQLIPAVLALMRETYPNVGKVELRRRTRDTIYGISHFACCSFVKHIVAAIGARELSETYERLLKEQPSAAIEVIHSSLAMEHRSSFPAATVCGCAGNVEKYPLAHSVLRQLVVEHLSFFPVAGAARQKVCEALGVSYQRLHAIASSRRLISQRTTRKRSRKPRHQA